MLQTQVSPTSSWPIIKHLAKVSPEDKPIAARRWHIGLYAIETFGGFAADGETTVTHERGWPLERAKAWPTFHVKANAEAYATTLNAGSLGAYMNGAYRGIRRSGGVRYAVKVSRGEPQPYGFDASSLVSLARQGAGRVLMSMLSSTKPSRPAVK